MYWVANTNTYHTVRKVEALNLAALLGKLLKTEVRNVGALGQAHVSQAAVIAQSRQPLISAVAAREVEGHQAVRLAEKFDSRFTDVFAVVDIEVCEAVTPVGR
jgi:hypothetical protein